MPDRLTIREAFAADAADVELIARLIREANADVAIRFGLSRENGPKHTAFCTASWVEADLARGERYFILEQDSVPVGCVAYEIPEPRLAYLNRLSVLPTFRKQGFGERLVKHVIALARNAAIERISIGVIGESADLQHWYRGLGFIDGETRRFPHLPFSVKYMSYPLASTSA